MAKTRRPGLRDSLTDTPTPEPLPEPATSNGRTKPVAAVGNDPAAKGRQRRAIKAQPKAATTDASSGTKPSNTIEDRTTVPPVDVGLSSQVAPTVGITPGPADEVPAGITHPRAGEPPLAAVAAAEAPLRQSPAGRHAVPAEQGRGGLRDGLAAFGGGVLGLLSLSTAGTAVAILGMAVGVGAAITASSRLMDAKSDRHR